MMKKMFRSVIPILFIGMCVFSCQENETEVVPFDEFTVEKNLVKNETRDQLVANLAQNLASGLQNETVRAFIKGKTIEQFDGDYNFLIVESRDQQVSVETSGRVSDGTFGEILAGTISNNGRATSVDLEALGELHPLLQVALPQLEADSAESWNIENETLLVAFLPSNYDESTSEYIPAYDADGNYFALSAKEEPDQLVLIISDNERLIAIEKGTSASGRTANELNPIGECLQSVNPYFESETHNYYLKAQISLIDECGGGGGGETGGGGSGGSNDCSRNVNDGRDVLYKGRFVNKDAWRRVEGWPAGHPEFRVTAAYVDNSTGSNRNLTTTKYISEKGWVKRGLFKNTLKTKTINIPIFTWFKDRHSLDMSYVWVEEDSGGNGTSSYTTTLSSKFDDNTTFTSTFTVTFDDNDEPDGDAIVQYEDSTCGDGTWYSTGIVNFSINQD